MMSATLRSPGWVASVLQQGSELRVGSLPARNPSP